MSETEILSQVLAGRTELYAEIFKRHRRRAFGLAFQYVRDQEEAKDVVQDAFIKAFQNLTKFDLGRDFGAWFMTIVRNLSIDFIRKRKKFSQDGLPDAVPDPSLRAKTEERVFRRQVWEALDHLKAEQREIIFLKDYQGHSYREIADILDIPLGTVMSRLHHARKDLIALLKEKD